MRNSHRSRRPYVSARQAKKVCKAAIATAVIFTGPIHAQTTRNWDAGAATGNWTDALNWSGDILPGITDIAAFNAQTAQQTITLGASPITIQTLNFTANTSSSHLLQNGAFILNSVNQTGDDGNALAPSVTITTKNLGADVLTSNVTVNTLQLQGQITAGGITKTGGGTLRLGTSGTNFNNVINGNVVINGGTFQASAADVAGQNNPLGGTGNITIGAANVTLSLTHGNATGATAIYDFGRDIVANDNSFTLNVNRSAGTQTGKISQAGLLTIGNATMSVTGDVAYQARLDGVNILSGATTILSINNNGSNAGGNHLRIDSLIGDATTTLQKNGGQTLFIGATAPAFAGKLVLNGGTTQIEADASGNAIANAQTLTFNSGSTLNLRSEVSSDYVVPVRFGPGVITSTISADRLSAGTAQVMSLGDVNASNATLTFSSGNNYGFALDSITVDAGATSTINVGTNGNGTVATSLLNLPANSVLNKTGGATLVLNGNQSATANGAINIRAGTINATAAGSLGTGLVTVGNTTPNSAGFLNDFSRLNWNAVGASANGTGVDAIAVAGGAIDLNVNPAATDIFDIKADGRIQGTATQLGALTIGANLTLSPNAIVAHEEPGAATGTVAGLANDASLFYGLANNATSLPTIGAGTPWKGISADNTARTIQGVDSSTPAIININGGDNNPATIEATLQSMNDVALNFGTATNGYTWTSTAAGGEKVTLAIRGALGTSNLGLVPGGRVLFFRDGLSTGIADAVDKIVVQSGALGLIANNALNGVPVDVLNGGSLDLGGTNQTAIDGNVNIKSGGVLFLTDPSFALAGTGIVTIEEGGKLDISGGAPANILTQSATNGQPINFTGSGHTVRFAADNVEELDTRVPNQNVTFVVAGGATTSGNFQGTTISGPSLNTQTAGLSLQNGTLTNDGTTRAFTAPLTLSDSNLTVAASRNTSFIVTSDITTTGSLQIGSLTAIDGRDKSNNSGALNSLGIPDPYNSGAQVILLGTVAANNVTAHNSHLAFGNANTTITGDLTVNGGILYLDGGGPISAGATAGQLTPKLAAGNLASRIILGQYTRSEMKLDLASDSNATVLEVNQPFVIDGDINPLDNRRFWVSRNSGTNNRVNFNNITLNAGSVFGVQEDNTDVRASLKLAGNATVSTTNSNNNIDYINISRDASLPAFDGTNPVILTQGRLNVPNWQGSNNTVSNVFGTLGAGVQVDIVRGQLLFLAGSAVDGVVRTQTAGAGGDSFVVSSSNSSNTASTTDTTIGGIGRIELGRSAAANGPEDFEIRGTEILNATAAQAPLHTHAGEIRVVNDGNASTVDGIVRSNRVNDSERTARVQVNNVVLENGSTVQLAASNGVPLTVSAINLQGSGTIDTASTGMTVNAVNAGSNVVTFTGAQPLNLTGAVTASQINVNNTTLSFPTDVNSTLNVNGGNATATGNVTGALSVTSGTATVNGNVTGALNVTTGTAAFNAGGLTKTVTGPVNLDAGNIVVTNGTLDLGSTVITSTPESTVAGLRELKITGAAFDVNTPNGSNIVKLGPVMAQSTTGWGSNETYVYSGQFFVPNNNGDGTGSFAFAENFDDSVRVLVDGNQVLNNGTFNDATGTGALTLATGWHDVEFRFGQGGGGAGPVTSDGWTNTFGFGLDLDTANGIDNSTTSPMQAQYVAPLDGGTMNLFRSTIASNLTIGADSNLRAGGFTNVGKISFTGTNSLLTLNPTSGPAVVSTASAIAVSTGATGTIDVVRAGDKVTVNSANLAGDLTIAGEGDVVVSAGATGAGAIVMDGDGTLTINGSVEGAAIVNSGTFNGNATIGGGIAVNDGELSPGLSAGVMTTTTLQAGPLAQFQLEIGSATTAGSALPGINFDQIVVTGDFLELGTAGLTLTVSSALIKDDVFTLILNNGTDTDPGAFSGLTNGAFINLPGGFQVQLSYFDNAATPGLELAGGNDVSVIVTVPEPSAAMALLGGLATLAGMRRFRRRLS